MRRDRFTLHISFIQDYFLKKNCKSSGTRLCKKAITFTLLWRFVTVWPILPHLWYLILEFTVLTFGCIEFLLTVLTKSLLKEYIFVGHNKHLSLNVLLPFVLKCNPCLHAPLLQVISLSFLPNTTWFLWEFLAYSLFMKIISSYESLSLTLVEANHLFSKSIIWLVKSRYVWSRI